MIMYLLNIKCKERGNDLLLILEAACCDMHTLYIILRSSSQAFHMKREI